MKNQRVYIIKPETISQSRALKAFIRALLMKFEVTDKTFTAEQLDKVLQKEAALEEANNLSNI